MARAGKVAVHRITTAGAAEPADIGSRERAYLVMMGIRFVAIIAAVVFSGFWRWVAIAAGVILPYVAVVTVNATKTRGTQADPAFWAANSKLAITGQPVPSGSPTSNEPAGRDNPGRRKQASR
jgi:xanthine/uracil permease